MKKISAGDAQKINDFALESPDGLPAYVLEKDVHVCDAMKILAALPASPLFKLVFCRRIRDSIEIRMRLVGGGFGGKANFFSAALGQTYV